MIQLYQDLPDLMDRKAKMGRKANLDPQAREARPEIQAQQDLPDQLDHRGYRGQKAQTVQKASVVQRVRRAIEVTHLMLRDRQDRRVIAVKTEALEYKDRRVLMVSKE